MKFWVVQKMSYGTEVDLTLAEAKALTNDGESECIDDIDFNVADTVLDSISVYDEWGNEVYNQTN